MRMLLKLTRHFKSVPLHVTELNRMILLVGFSVILMKGGEQTFSAADVTSTWIGGSPWEGAAWSDGSHWTSDPLYPNNGNGGFTFHAIVESPSTLRPVLLTEPITVESLTVQGPNTVITGDFDLTVNGTATWTGGIVGGAGDFKILGELIFNGSARLAARAIGGGGTLRWSGGYIYMSEGAVINNTGLFEISNDGSLWGTLNNSGLLKKSSATGTSEILGALNNQGGLVEIQTGTLHLTLNGGDGVISGTYETASGTYVDFDSFSGWSWTLDPAATFIGTGARLRGTLNLAGMINNLSGIALTGGTITGDFAVPGALHLAGAYLVGTVDPNVPINWSAGGITGPGTQTINAGNTLRIDGSVIQDERTLNNFGTTILGASASSVHYVRWNGTFNNYGTYVLYSGSQATTLAPVNGTFNNSGTLQKAAGAGNAAVQGLNNTGTILVQGGFLDLRGGFVQTAGRIVLAGGGIGPCCGISLSGGTLEGSGIVVGIVFNYAGAILPGGAGSAGAISISSGVLNHLQLESASHVVFEVGGVTPGSEYDTMTVDGSTVLGGTIELVFINGFQTSVTGGMSFRVLTNTGQPIGGSFANVLTGERLLTSDGHGSFVVNYGTGSHANEVTLTDFQPAAPGDLDADRLPDDYELAHGLDPTNAADATRDHDGDGVSGWEEYLAGTDPQNPEDALLLSELSVNGVDVTLGFKTAASKAYRVDRSNDSPGGPWTAVSASILGDGTVKLTTDPGGAAVPRRFYRVVVIP